MSEARSVFRAPAWLNSTLEEEREAFALMLLAIHEDGPLDSSGSLDSSRLDFLGLVWCLALRAVRAARPKTRGRKRQWTWELGSQLVIWVDAELKRRGKESADRKAVITICANIKKTKPALWGDSTPEQMRKRYYKARDGFYYLQSLVSGNAAEFPDPKSGASL